MNWISNHLSAFATSRVGKHSLLIAVLVLGTVLGGLFAGWFARKESKAWLCQYDAKADLECVKILDPSADNPSRTTGSPTTNAASPLASASTDSHQVNAQSPANVNANASETPTPSPSSSASPSAGSAQAKNSPTPTPNQTPLSAEQKVLLAKQSTEVNGLIRHHAQVMAFFYEAYYTAIGVVLFAGALLAIALFFIAKDGWSNTNEYVKTLFIVMAATAAFYGLWPPVFQQEKNISDNKALFLEYETLAREIDSYPVTRTTVKNEPKEPSAFINYVDFEMDRLGNVAIGFDYTKITYKGAFDTKSAPAPASSPTPTPKK